MCFLWARAKPARPGFEACVAHEGRERPAHLGAHGEQLVLVNDAAPVRVVLVEDQLRGRRVVLPRHAGADAKLLPGLLSCDRYGFVQQTDGGYAALSKFGRSRLGALSTPTNLATDSHC